MAPLLLAPARGILPRRFSPIKIPGGRVHLRLRAESPIFEDLGGRRSLGRVPPVFNPTRWSYHQDTGRYARHLTSIFKSITFRNLQAPLSFLTLASCLVVLYRTLVDIGELPDLFEGIKFTDTPFQLTSFALSLLLVFRTDASYGRWCAAMDAWGSLRISTSQIVRKATAWVAEPAALHRLVRWVGAFPLCLMVELRHDHEDPSRDEALRQELGQVLRPHEVEQVVASGPYYHQFCLSVLTALIEATQLSESRETTMLEDLNGFNLAASECEKIMRFPIPLTYTRHTSRFMLIYLAALPLALYDSCGWAAVPVTVVISFLLLGIEDIGVQIEEPFSILPLPRVCEDLRNTAERAVAQRSMVRCLADPDTCNFSPEELLAVAGASGSSRGPGVAAAAAAWSGPRDHHQVVASGEFDEEEEMLLGSGGRGSGGGNVAGSSKVAAMSVSACTAASAGAYSGGNGVGRGSYIYSKGAGLVAAVAEDGVNGHANGHADGMMSGRSVPHHHQHQHR